MWALAGWPTSFSLTQTQAGSGEGLEPEEDRPCPRASSKYISLYPFWLGFFRLQEAESKLEPEWGKKKKTGILSGSSWKNRNCWSYFHTRIGPQRLHDTGMQKLRSQRRTVSSQLPAALGAITSPSEGGTVQGVVSLRPGPGPMHQTGHRGWGNLVATRVTKKTQPWATGSERSKAREGKEFFGFSPSIFLEPFSLSPNGRGV